MGESSIRLGPVAEAAIRTLLGAVERSVDTDLGPPLADLIDLDVACTQARRFKLDASFSLRSDGVPQARLSVNDKGEPRTFRERLRDLAPALGLERATVDAMLTLCPAGLVQTTLGVKWGPGGGRPDRVSLYFEELFRRPEGEAIRRRVFEHGVDTTGFEIPPPVPHTRPVSVCIDYAAGAPIAVKDYWMATERADASVSSLPGPLAAHRDRFPIHPVNHHRRYLIARRYDRDGTPTGQKLLWMSEVHRNETLAWAWREVDRLRTELALPPSATSAALDALRDGWTHAPGTFLHPDLVSLNAGTDGVPDALLVYVSVR